MIYRFRRHAWLLMLALLAGTAALPARAVHAEPRPGGELTAAIPADPQGLDPHRTSAYSSFQVLENVYDTLVSVADDLTIEPALAESWTVSDDNLIWTFHLRPGVRFHNGRVLTADDVVYSLERIRNPETGSGAGWRLDAVDAIEAPNARTVVVRLKYPYPGILAKLGGYKGMAIVARENVESGEVDRHPVGTGPFRFVEYVPGDRVVLEKNPGYWQEGKPYLDRVVFRIVPEAVVRLTSLQTGETDWISDLPPDRIDAIAAMPGIEVGRAAGTSYWYLGINLKREPLGDARVRRAIAHAIDRGEIAQAARWEAAAPNDGPLPPGSFWATDYHPYHPYSEEHLQTARRLLAEAGHPDGFEAEVMVTTQYQESIVAAQVLQAQLARIGIKLRIRTLEWGTWLDEQGKGNFDLYVLNWIGNIDPDDYFYAQHRTGEVFNFTGYSSSELDRLLDEGRRETDRDRRRVLYEQVQRTIIDDAPYVYLYVPTVTHAWRDDVQGYVTRSDEAIRFVDTWLDR